MPRARRAFPPKQAFSQNLRWPSLDTDREGGCVREMAHAYSQEGGLAVLFGNIAEQGCVVKTAGVDEESLQFTGPAHVCESQEAAVADILEDRVKAGDVVIVRYEGASRRTWDAGDALPDQLSQIEGAG